MKIYSTVLMFLGISCVVFATPPSAEPSPPSPSATAASSSVIPSPASPNPSSSADASVIPPNAADGEPNASGTLPSAADEGALPSTPAGPPSVADPNALIPAAEAAPSPPNPKFAEAQQKENTTKELVKYKAVRIEAEKDPTVRTMYNRAQKASTEEDYRAAMREYYRRLFKKIELLDPSLAKKAQAMQEAYQRRLAQTRIEPTIPIHPPPTPEPLSP